MICVVILIAMVIGKATVMMVLTIVVIIMATFVRVTIAPLPPLALCHRLLGLYRAAVGREHAAWGRRSQRPHW